MNTIDDYEKKQLLRKVVIKIEFITFIKKKIPVLLARKLLTIASYVVPLNKFYRDLSTAIFNHVNKRKK